MSASESNTQFANQGEVANLTDNLTGDTEAQRVAQSEDDLERAEALEAKRRLEMADEDAAEEISVEVGGEQIKMTALQGLGQKTNLARRMIEAERDERKAKQRGDEKAADEASIEQMIILDDMVDQLHEQTVHGDVFDRTFWNRRDEEQIMDAIEDLSLKSRGGQDAGNSSR